METVAESVSTLRGRVIAEWIGTELAIAQEPPITWGNLTDGTLQFYDLDLLFSDGLKIRFSSGFDKEFNFYELKLSPVEVIDSNFSAAPGDFMRRLNLAEMPIGEVSSVSTSADKNGCVTSLVISTSSGAVKIASGEVVSDGNSITIHSPQEFIVASYATSQSAF